MSESPENKRRNFSDNSPLTNGNVRGSYSAISPNLSRHSRSRSRSQRRRSGSGESAPSYREKRRSNSRSRRRRSYSKSPPRRNYDEDKDQPKANKCIGIFGLSVHTTERELRSIMREYGQLDDLKIVYDHYLNRSRGFAFAYYKHLSDAIDAKEQGSGMDIDGKPVRIDFSVTRKPHSPTPGVYMGRSTRSPRRSSPRRRRESPRRRYNSPRRNYNSPPRRRYGSPRDRRSRRSASFSSRR